MNPIDMQVTDYNCEYLGLPRLCLMENAGKSLSDEVAKLSTFKFSKPVKILIFTGSGGNGGDGFVAARHLLNRGFEVDLYLLKNINEIKSNDALTNLKILNNLNPRISRLNIKYLQDSNDVDKLKSTLKKTNEEYIIIDGILGTGIKGKLRIKERKTIELINELNALKIAIDVPSGLNPLTGEISDISIIADYTVSFHKIKTGLKKANNEILGNLITCDIGIPLEAELLVGSGDLLKLNKRLENSHKGDNGKVLIIGGSKEYSGAPAIAGMSAIASGADLVYIMAPESSANSIKSYSPDLIVKSLKGDYLNLQHEEEILEIIEKVDAILIGPGSSQNDETAKLFNKLAVKIKKPYVLDADALKLIKKELIKNNKDIVLTPHQSEFNTFYNGLIDSNKNIKINRTDFNSVNDKINYLQSVTSSFKGVTVLKGELDFILQGSKIKINSTGNSAMTVGGTGDSLAGLIVGLISQSLTPFDAGSIGAFIHGKAGEDAFEKYGNGFSAVNLKEFIGKNIVGNS